MSNYYELNSKSPRDRSVKARAEFVASEIIGLLDTIAQVAAAEGWDGRELVLGTALAYRRICETLAISAERAMQIMIGLGAAKPQGGRGAVVPLIVAPDGRPLAAPPGRTKG